jgi:hypothetical protein
MLPCALPVCLHCLQALLELCRFRNEHPAFKGRVYVDDSSPASQLRITWHYKGVHKAVLHADVATHEFSISHTPYSAVDGMELSGLSSFEGRGIFSVFSCDALDLPSRKLKRTRMMAAAATAAAAEGSASESDNEGAGGVVVRVDESGKQLLDLSWAWKTAAQGAAALASR